MGADFLDVSPEEMARAMAELTAAPAVTILGIGNVILQDEGFGVRALELLRETYDFPPEVQLIDGGTLGAELLSFITGTERLLVLDSINGGEAAGTLFRFENEAVMAHFQDKLSVHEVGIQDVLATLEVTGRPIPSVVVLGAQPYAVGAGVALTPAMAALLPEMERRALEELARWGIVPVKKVQRTSLCHTRVAEAGAADAAWNGMTADAPAGSAEDAPPASAAGRQASSPLARQITAQEMIARGGEG